jgi:hypothetical protein
MRREAANRARRQEERENEVERQLDAQSTSSTRRRPASAGAASSGRKASSYGSQPQSHEQTLQPQPESMTNKVGDFASFVAGGSWRGATGQVDCAGYPIAPRRPFTSIPGYGGYVPRKAPDSIIGCTFHRGNMVARGSLLTEFNARGSCLAAR